VSTDRIAGFRVTDSESKPLTLIGPLAGIRLVELACILAGPWIGQTLADLGADVVKVEAPEGDETRRWGPPFVQGVDGSACELGIDI
jgi:crotonobetainyl-CoA:carnitine CoA-transferase CaiB-like acyl-CoA transferase